MLNVIILAIGLAFNPIAPNSTYTTENVNSSVEWTATKVVGGGHNGTVNISKGTLELNGSTLKGGSFVIDMTSINCQDLEGQWKDKLEDHLKSEDFFAVDTYKTASLEITKVKSKSEGKYDITGDFTIKGKTVSIVFPAELSLQKGKAIASAKITLDRTKYDIRYGSNSFFDNLGDKAISDEFTLEINLIATK